MLIAANAHKAERAHALATGLRVGIVPVRVDTEWDIEHGVEPAALAQALVEHPHARAFVLVSPTYFGVTSDVASLADLCHDHDIPLICDAAWGGAFAFSQRLPADPLSKGADLTVYSLHKTMGALAQGSAILAKSGVLDLQSLWMAYELFETTSPSVPILASLDATRRDHAIDGERLWAAVLDTARDLRQQLGAMEGIRVFGIDDLPGGAELDESKILVDVSALGVSGYAIDDWLAANHRVSVGLSDARHLLMVMSLGTRRADVRALVRGLRELVDQLAVGTSGLPPARAVPGIDTLHVEMAMDPRLAFDGPTEPVRIEDAAGRIAAEMIAPAPPVVPRLVPGQMISEAHVRWLVAQRDAGAFFLDPIDPSESKIRVVAGSTRAGSARSLRRATALPARGMETFDGRH